MKALLVVSLMAVGAFAQSIPATGDFSKLPSYLVGIGGEMNPSGALLTFAIRVGQSPVYSWTTMDTPVQQPGGQVVASMRTGVAYVAAHSGHFFLFLLGDAGYSAGANGSTLGAYSGGTGVFWNPRRFPQLFIGPLVRAIKLSSSAVQPVPEFMLSWGF